MQHNWTIEEKHLELKYTWKISRNTSDFKTNFIIRIADENYSGIGEVAPNSRYNESPELIKEQFIKFLSVIPFQIASVEELQQHLNKVVVCNSLRFGIESAFIHYLCKRDKITIYNLLNIKPPVLINTAYTLPIMEIGSIQDFIKNNDLSRFKHIKIKVNREKGFDTIKEVSKYIPQPLMVDANEDWKNVEDLIRFMEQVKKINIRFIEQPLPSSHNEEYMYLKKYSLFELMADESIIATADFGLLKKQFDGVNMKLMKAGGYLNGLSILNAARKNGMKIMIGCMIETSLGISSAMHLCNGVDYVDLDGCFILKDEPFGLLKENEGQLKFT